MQVWRSAASTLIAFCAGCVPAVLASDQAVQFIADDRRTGQAQAVIVSDVPLVQTTQLLPLDSQGKVAGPAGKQTSQLLKNIEGSLAEAGSGLQHLVRINLYITQPEDVEEILKQLGRSLKGRASPSITRVITALPLAGAKVAADALAVTVSQTGLAAVSYLRMRSSGVSSLADLSILPAGRKVYVSGQAGQGQLLEATAKTMEQLESTLRSLALDWTDVVQLKAFLHPMERVNEVRNVMAGHIKNGKVPPLAFVEWTSNVPIEIELVASGNRLADQWKSSEPVSYITPAGMTASPVYSRVSVIHSGQSVYVSSIYGDTSASAREEVRSIFVQLRELLKLAGTNFNQLVKATYYVADDASSKLLNDLRPDFYDPKRPPAASKAIVKGVGKPGHSLTLDMIAVASD